MKPIRIALVAMLAIGLCAAGTILAGPAAATTAYVDGSSVLTPLVANGRLDAVDCPSTAFCMAVGSGEVIRGEQRALAERPQHGVWQRVPVPDPAGAQDAAFHGVDCRSASFCIAVGDYYSGSLGAPRQSLIESWNGESWQVMAHDAAGSATELLRSVSCASETFCIAVGETDRGSESANTLIEYWNGASWRVVGSPSPRRYSRLRGVACPSTTMCIAVGTSGDDDDSRDATGPLREMLTPQGWVVQDDGQAAPSLTKPDLPGYYGISCTSTTFCLEVGWYYSYTTQSQVTADRWDGTTWTSVPVDWKLSRPELDAVSCTSPTFCKVFGRSPGSVSDAGTGTWDGATLTSAKVLPEDLTGLSCTTATHCVGVGTTGTTSVRVFNGTRWIPQSSADLSGDPGSELTAVSCPTFRHCLALGDEVNSTGGHNSIAVQTNLDHIRQMTAPSVPSDVVWQSLSCTTTTFCAAGGVSFVGNGPKTLQTWNGTAWTPSPVTPVSYGGVAVSCVSSTSCLAVGGTHVVRWDGTSWATAPSLVARKYLAVASLDCVAADDCVAVGSYDSTGADRSVIEHWDGSSWSVVPRPRGPAGLLDSRLTGVSCIASNYCVAVGSGYVTGIGSTSLIDTWDGTSWKSTPHPTSPAALTSVACGAIGECVAGADATRALYSTGGTWSTEAVYPPNGYVDIASGNRLEAVSCADQYHCTAVGSFDRAAGPMAMVVYPAHSS